MAVLRAVPPMHVSIVRRAFLVESKHGFVAKENVEHLAV